jgi:hypothetical protein
MLKYGVIRLKEPPPLTSQVDAYRARAAEYDRKAETLGNSNAAIRDYYGRLAQHWRSMALLAEDRAAREQSVHALILASSKLDRRS